jgi:hypothetical protein
VFALRIVRLGIVHERFLTIQSESIGRKKAALGIALTPIEVDDHAHATIPSSILLAVRGNRTGSGWWHLRCRYWLWLFHMYPSSSSSLRTLST